MRVAADQRFTATVDAYDRHRPSYPPALIDWVVGTAALTTGATVVDLGCGTGISTRLVAARGFEVIGVDPNAAMLTRARERGGPARFVLGDAHATTLPDACADLVVAAQAFHWFDVPRALDEIARVLRPTGSGAAFWNVRAATPAMDAYEALLLARSREYATLRTPEQTIAAIAASDRIESPVEAEFPNVQRFDWAGFRGRVFSSSYVVHGVDDLPAFEVELRALFDAHARDGVLDFAYRTIGVGFRPRRAR
ncbi:MAG: class I SAM-dependent methyltransferase [Polyangiales bacterium]